MANKEEKTLEQMKKEFEAMGKAIQQKEQEELEKKRAEERVRKLELEKQKEARKKEIDKKTEELGDLIKEFVEDYGYYSNQNANTPDDIRNLLAYWMHRFWM